MVTNTELQRVGPSGWSTGLANLMRKENRAWWGSRRWLVQGLLWTLIIDGLVAAFMVILLVTDSARMTSLAAVEIGIEILFKIGTLALGIGAIILVQDELIGERQLGVTEWLLSKPVSRLSYLLSKLFAHGLGVVVMLVGMQGAVGYGLLSAVGGQPLPIGSYLVAETGLAVHTLFYLALTLMLGVLTANRNHLLGVSLGVLLTGTLFGGFLGPIILVTPWSLGSFLAATVQGHPLPVTVWLPIGATAALTLTFVAVALARFERLEF